MKRKMVSRHLTANEKEIEAVRVAIKHVRAALRCLTVARRSTSGRVAGGAREKLESALKSLDGAQRNLLRRRRWGQIQQQVKRTSLEELEAKLKGATAAEEVTP